MRRARTFALPAWNRLSTPIPRSNRWRGAIRGGLVTSSSVPSAGIFRRVAPPPESQLVIGLSRVATVLPQKNPMAAC